MDVLFFGKGDHWASGLCVEFLENMKANVQAHTGTRGAPFPKIPDSAPVDLLLSFSSPWIIPVGLLQRARVAALNFHPGPPEYPGIGCTNFAIYHEETAFGVTCHHMAAKVDTGAIVAVRRFPLLASDSVKSLTDRCYHHMYALFVEVIGGALAGAPLAASDETWTRKPYTRRELDDLCRLDRDMDDAEIARRIRATTFPGYPGARFGGAKVRS